MNVKPLAQMDTTDLKDNVTLVTIIVLLVTDQTMTNVPVVNQTDSSTLDLAHKTVQLDSLPNKTIPVTLVNNVTELVPLVTTPDLNLVPLVMNQDSSTTTFVLNLVHPDSTLSMNQKENANLATLLVKNVPEDPTTNVLIVMPITTSITELVLPHVQVVTMPI